MELKIENKIKIKNGLCVGILDQEEYLMKCLESINIAKTNIAMDGKKLNQKELIALKKRISVIKTSIHKEYLKYSVYEYMKAIIMENSLDIKDYRKKIIDSLKIVGLNETYVNKQIVSLSRSEEALLCFATGLLSNPDIILFHYFFSTLDGRMIKKVLRLIQQLTDQFHKMVIISTRNIEEVFSYCQYMIILNNKKVIVADETNKIFENKINQLLENKIALPKSIQFSYLVNQTKNIKLGYFRDIRDLIKDIYKKV